ncbi:MAG: restriction endonuclease subunit S [Elusimicrobiales bacterium]|nr:restriction endonuclease subunit S [Elusimicrobiales bacterium]
MSNKKAKATGIKQDAKHTFRPKLRFPEFRGANGWTTKTLASVVSINTEKVGDKTCIPMSITSGIGLVSQMEKFGRIIAGSSYANYLLLKKNDFAYNKSATKEFPEGFIALYSGNELAAVPNSIFTCFRIKGDSPIPQYLNHLFLGNLHGQWLKRFIEVGARAHGSLSIDDNDLLALPVPLPNGESSLREQQKIADCLSSMDELIAAQARKVDTLKTHKKGLMQQLFPNEGETLPRLRFPEFQSEKAWEEETGSSLFDQVNDRSPEPGLPILAITQEYGAIPRNMIDYHVSVTEKSIENYKVVQVGDFIISLRSFQGGIEYSQYHGICSPAYVILRRRIAGSDAYFKHYLKTDRFIRILTRNLEGLRDGKMISYSKFSELLVPVPSPPEQIKIADCLSALDDEIFANTKKLDELKTHKNGLMQQLLPYPEDAEA